MKKLISLKLLILGLIIAGCAQIQNEEIKVSDGKNQFSNIDLSACKTYYDGCNTCFVEYGEIKGCTKKFCDESSYEEAKCVEYNPKACTQEVKTCPDGSAVGRTGPNCEFSKCPEPTHEITPPPESPWPAVGSCEEDGPYASASTIVGAIRWDAWVGAPDKVGAAVEASLSPNQFHFRVPFYGKEINNNKIEARCITQSCMDQEIAYAKFAGLDYWAFLWYPEDSGLQQSLNLYLKSGSKDKIKFSLIMSTISWGYIPTDKLESYFAMDNYQTVLGNRPLFYIFPAGEQITKTQVDKVRAAAIAAGRGDPYIVFMRSGNDISPITELGIDAFSKYAVGGRFKNGVPYAELADADVGQWNWVRDQGIPLIPHITTGWDPRPRALTPVFWGTSDPDNWVQTATPDEITAHVQTAMDWIKANPSTAEADAIIMYAWNEFDEGGWIAPTLKAYGGTERIDALASLLSYC